MEESKNSNKKIKVKLEKIILEDGKLVICYSNGFKMLISKNELKSFSMKKKENGYDIVLRTESETTEHVGQKTITETTKRKITFNFNDNYQTFFGIAGLIKNMM